MANFVSYSDMTTIMTAIGNKFAALNGAYVIKGNSAFASLPATPTAAQEGFVYNVTDAFTTDARFVEGSGKAYPADTNVVIVNVGTAEVPNMKFDVIGGFVDVSALETAIQEVSDTIGASFDPTAGVYSIGDLVIKDGVIYRFKAAHSAGAWDASEVDAIGSVFDLIASLGDDVEDVEDRVDTVVSNITDEFDPDKTGGYSVGAVVTYEDGLYQFTSAHTEGDPWDPTEVSAVTIEELIDDAEPESLTPAQISALTDLL